MWRKGNPSALLVGMQTGAATVESSMEIPQKIKNEIASCPSNSLSGNISKETENANLKEYMYPYVHCTVFIIAEIWMQFKCPSIDEWMEKLGYIHKREYHPAIKGRHSYHLWEHEWT